MYYGRAFQSARSLVRSHPRSDRNGKETCVVRAAVLCTRVALYWTARTTQVLFHSGRDRGWDRTNSGRFGTLAVIHFASGILRFDFALIKTTPIGHRESGSEIADLQFRAELFNLLNR